MPPVSVPGCPSAAFPSIQFGHVSTPRVATDFITFSLSCFCLEESLDSPKEFGSSSFPSDDSVLAPGICRRRCNTC